MKALFIVKPFVIEPLGLMYLSAAAKKAGHKVELAVADDDLERRVKEYSPEIIGYSLITGDQSFFLNLNKTLKKHFDFLSVFGGPHPTFFPNIIEEEGVDIICRGEGEEAFVELLDAREKGRKIEGIRNLYVKTKSGIARNEMRPFTDLDSLPFPDRSLLTTIPRVRDGPIKHFIASRGCPFNCSYCFNEKYSELYEGKGKKVRFRSVDSVLEEVKKVVASSPTRFVYFQDDTFTLDREWLREFSEKYAKKISLPFHCHVRANTLDENRAESLKKSGCYSVHIAAETASDRIRNEILSRNMSREDIIGASKILREKGIRFMMQNIIGLPTGTIEDDLATLDLNITCKPDYAWVSIFQPYPGTKLGEYCREKGFYKGDFNDLDSNFFDSSRLNFSKKYKDQLALLQRLFAIFVEYPELHRWGLSKAIISAKLTSGTREVYKRAYQEFRKKADERLYGFSL